MQTLLERGLVEPLGRAEVAGRPITYGTTALFLEYFGLRSLEDLPAADELRRMPVKKPEALVTADSGLATVPPEQLALPGQAGQSLPTDARRTETGPAAAPSEPPAQTEAGEQPTPEQPPA